MPITAASFKKLSTHIGPFPAYTNIGVIENGKDLYVIDSGVNSTDGEDIVKALKELYPSSSVKAILNTHSHSDHCGGNAKIQELTKAKIYAPFNESRLMEFPEAMIAMYWGAHPFEELRKIHYMQLEPTFPDTLIHANDEFNFGSASVKCIPLPGHYFDQTGFLVTDASDGKKSFFLGDGLFGMSMIKKYWIPFMVDPNEFRKSVMLIDETQADFFVPSHGDVTEGDKIHALSEINIMITLETEILIIKTLQKASLTHEELLEAVAGFAGIDLKLGQYVLIGSTIKSYLSSLLDKKIVSYTIEDNRMLWSATKGQSN